MQHHPDGSVRIRLQAKARVRKKECILISCVRANT
jgi:hypothetical protein